MELFLAGRLLCHRLLDLAYYLQQSFLLTRYHLDLTALPLRPLRRAVQDQRADEALPEQAVQGVKTAPATRAP